jgi:phosphoribosyl 1,2-cyclic phosphodiesterase
LSIKSRNIFFLGGTQSPGYSEACESAGKSRVQLCSDGDQLNRKLASELPAAVLIHNSYVKDLPLYLNETFTQMSGRRFISTAILCENKSETQKTFEQCLFPVHLIEDKSADDIAKFISDSLEPSINVKFWGVRGSTPCPNSENIRYGGNTSCVEIEIPGYDRKLILDSGTGIRNLGNYLETYASGPIDADLFITHPHWDHIQGFPFFSPFYKKENAFRIHLPEQYRGGAKDILAGHLTKTFFPVTLGMFSSDINYITQEETTETFGPVEVDYMVANHPTKTAMYRFRIYGYTIIFAPDNELPMATSPLRFADHFCDFIKDCDLLIHDAQYDLDLLKSREGWGHSAWERVLELSKQSGVKRLYLTHHDPDSSDRKLNQLSKRLELYQKEAFKELALAREGLSVKLPVDEAKLI